MAYIDLQKLVDEKGSILTTSYSSEADKEAAEKALLKALTEEARKHIIHVRPNRRTTVHP